MRSHASVGCMYAVCHLLLASLWRVQLQPPVPMLPSGPSCEAQRSSGRKTENNSGFANPPPLRHGSSPATASPSSADAQLLQMRAGSRLHPRQTLSFAKALRAKVKTESHQTCPAGNALGERLAGRNSSKPYPYLHAVETAQQPPLPSSCFAAGIPVRVIHLQQRWGRDQLPRSEWQRPLHG